MAGFIYIMSNPAFPNLLKIGKTSKDPTSNRINELNTTGVPYPFRCEYYALVTNHDLFERMVHKELNQFRTNENREFFEVDCSKVINLIRDKAKAEGLFKYEEVFYVSLDALKKQRERENEQRKLEELKEKQRLEREANMKLSEQAETDKQRAEEKIAAEEKSELTKDRMMGIFTIVFLFFTAFIFAGLFGD